MAKAARAILLLGTALCGCTFGAAPSVGPPAVERFAGEYRKLADCVLLAIQGQGSKWGELHRIELPTQAVVQLFAQNRHGVAWRATFRRLSETETEVGVGSALGLVTYPMHEDVFPVVRSCATG